MAREPETYETKYHQVTWTCGIATWVANCIGDEALDQFVGGLGDGCRVLKVTTDIR